MAQFGGKYLSLIFIIFLSLSTVKAQTWTYFNSLQLVFNGTIKAGTTSIYLGNVLPASTNYQAVQYLLYYNIGAASGGHVILKLSNHYGAAFSHYTMAGLIIGSSSQMIAAPIPSDRYLYLEIDKTISSAIYLYVVAYY